MALKAIRRQIGSGASVLCFSRDKWPDQEGQSSILGKKSQKM